MFCFPSKIPPVGYKRVEIIEGTQMKKKKNFFLGFFFFWLTFKQTAYQKRKYLLFMEKQSLDFVFCFHWCKERRGMCTEKDRIPSGRRSSGNKFRSFSVVFFLSFRLPPFVCLFVCFSQQECRHSSKTHFWFLQDSSRKKEVGKDEAQMFQRQKQSNYFTFCISIY